MLSIALTTFELTSSHALLPVVENHRLKCLYLASSARHRHEDFNNLDALFDNHQPCPSRSNKYPFDILHASIFKENENDHTSSCAHT